MGKKRKAQEEGSGIFGTKKKKKMLQSSQILSPLQIKQKIPLSPETYPQKLFKIWFVKHFGFYF